MLKRFAPRRIASDWFLYIVLAIASQCLPRILIVSGWFPGAQRLVATALWGAVLGMVMAYSRIPAVWAWILGLLLAFGQSIHFAGDVLPSRQMLAADLSRLGMWVREEGLRNGSALPPSYALSFLVSRVDGVIRAVWLWIAAMQRGAVSTDNTVLQISVSLGVWFLHWNLSYQLFRWHRALAGLVPLGVAVLAAVSFTNLGILYAQIYLGIALLAWLWARSGRMQMIWERAGVGVSPDWRRHLFWTGAPLAGLVFVVALSLPYAAYDRTVYYFWDRVGHRLRTFYDQLDRAFAGRQPLAQPTPSVGESDDGGPGLGEHDIRTGVNTSDRLVFTVRTSDLAADPPGQNVPKRYWRERTYDRYTGTGWASSPTRTTLFQQGAAWKEVYLPHTVVTQTFSLLLGPGRGVAVNEPVSVDRPYYITSRGAGDLAALAVDVAAYTVVSSVPQATAAQLREAESAYPEWVEQRYLVLPDIPARIGRLAAQVVQQAGAETRYDKARAIEAYLRRFAYDEELEPPPWDRDVVDYFVFTARRGYCDYSATAMVVMLRSLGVAARYASGYGTGTYDPRIASWVVTGKNAHAWAEVYFPNLGWIEFEPTPSQTLFVREEGHPLAESTPTPGMTPEPNALPTELPSDQMDNPSVGENGLPLPNRQTLQRLAQVSLLVLLLGIVVWWPRLYLQLHPTPRQVIWRIYGRMLQRARFMGIIPDETLTPREALQRLIREIGHRERGTRSTASQIALLGQLYERARYSADTLGSADAEMATATWQRLRGPLTRLIWARPPRRKGGQNDGEGLA